MESSGSSQQDAQPCATFDKWKYKHHFVIVEEGDKNIRAHCKLCVGNKTLSCARNTTSNFKKHLENVHKYVQLEAWPVDGAKRKCKRPRADDDGNSDDERHVHPTMKRQCTLPSMLKDACSAKLCDALAEYVIEQWRIQGGSKGSMEPPFWVQL